MKDIHITRSACAEVTIENGKVTRIGKPVVKKCPLHKYLYKKEIIHTEEFIQMHVERKMEKVGMFTKNRIVETDNDLVPYGASEILMNARQENKIDCAILACDGAGTVIATRPTLIQGIGEWMGGLIKTSPIKEVIERIEKAEGIVVCPETAEIDQVSGVKMAIEKGFKKITVTIAGMHSEILAEIRNIEKENDVDITILTICNSGIPEKNALIMTEYADLVWACASKEVWKHVGPKAIMQIGINIPVFALTKKGIELIELRKNNLKGHHAAPIFTENLPFKIESGLPEPLV